MDGMKNDWTVLYCDTVEDMESLILDKDFVWPLILSGIRDMIDSGRSSIVILEGKMINVGTALIKGSGGASVWITMSENDVMSSLDRSLKWRESREEYEECVYIKTLMNDWVDSRNAKIADSLL